MSMKRSEQSGLKALAIIIFVITVAFSIFRCYYFFTHKGEEFGHSLIKRILWPPEESQEVIKTTAPMKLTVNPNYDGMNKEYVHSDTADVDAVTRICLMASYRYYNNEGDAVETVETWAYNARGEILFMGYRRGSCKMPDTSVMQKKIEITYRYDDDMIYRDCTTGLYADDVCLSSTTESSEKERT